ncbi:MAG: MFS transporter [Halieaceae bacterium]|nr:MFS transporter [Halieaceae bacterium]
MNLHKIPVRWRLFGVLFLLSFLSYLMRQNIHVAGELMMPELQLSELEMGWIYASFIWGYALFQLPGGIAGSRFGPRRTLLVVGLLGILASGLTGLLPGLLFQSTTGVIAVLLLVRFIMGIAHAPMYPIQAAVVERWFPVGQWALPNAVSSTGLTLGAAAAQPLVAVVMVYWGWRASFYVFIPLGLGLFGLWWWYARDNPAEHPAMGEEELSTIQANRDNLTQEVGFNAWKQLIRNRETLLLAFSYFALNYVFYLFFTWFFHYLVKELGFSILETGFLAALPWVTGAFVATLGGLTCDFLCRRLGPNLGCRIPAIVGLTGAGCLLYAGLYSTSPYMAVALLSLCFASTQFAEGAFWSAQTFVAGPYTAPACGLMNTGGNAAGIVVAPLMPFLAQHIGWVAALSTGSVVAFTGALLWLFVRVDRPFQPQTA